MIAGGVLGVFCGGLSGAWMAILGWFLLSAGASEEAGSAVRSLLRSGPRIGGDDIARGHAADWVTVEQFLESVAEPPLHDIPGARSVWQADRGGPALRPGAPARRRAGRKHLIDVARPIAEVPVTNPREDLSALYSESAPGWSSALLVFDNGTLVGILSPADIGSVRRSGRVPVRRRGPEASYFFSAGFLTAFSISSLRSRTSPQPRAK